MHRNLRVVLPAALLLAAPLVAAADDALPTAEAVIEKSIAAMGGRAALEKLQSQILTGKIEVVGKGVNGTITIYHAAPAQMRTVIEFEGIGKMEDGIDNGIAWSDSAMQGPRIKDGQEKALALRSADFRSELNWRQVYAKAAVTGVEDVEGKPCYKLELTPKDGSAMTRYHDKKSGLAVKTSMVVSSPMGEVPVEGYISDYRAEGELMVPHKIVQKVAGQELSMTITSVQNNVSIEKSRFDMPDAVRALVKK